MSTGNETSTRRKLRNRSKVRVASAGRPRLSIYRSSKYIYAQIIDDAAGKTVAQIGSKAIKVGTVRFKGSVTRFIRTITWPPCLRTWAIPPGWA